MTAGKPFATFEQWFSSTENLHGPKLKFFIFERFFMKKKYAISLFVFFVAFFAQLSGYAQDRQPFYAAMAAKDAGIIDKQLEVVRKSSSAEKTALEGALLMRKAGVVGGAGRKLKLFKEGKSKLEEAISKDGNNAEYRFLRLMIQENAPGIVNYSGDIDEDKEFIRKHHKKLPPAVQSAVASYARNSKVLRPEDL
ncbi:hypothetical protein [Terrimonas ferruginea]|uniref:hypothetical protein n=1 Tax=Terrimonas ferruginea TaxID=249 RepID=UPI000412E22D|nr:hypothetical protein [Terrimonas ferruginea]